MKATIWGSPAVAPATMRGTPLLIIAACHCCRVSAPTLRVHLAALALIAASHFWVCWAARAPGEVVTALTPSVIDWPACPRLRDHFAPTV